MHAFPVSYASTCTSVKNVIRGGGGVNFLMFVVHFKTKYMYICQKYLKGGGEFFYACCTFWLAAKAASLSDTESYFYA